MLDYRGAGLERFHCTDECILSFPCSDGQVYTWGKSQRGRLGREAEEPSHEPKPVIFDPLSVVSLCSNHGLTFILTRRTAS